MRTNKEKYTRSTPGSSDSLRRLIPSTFARLILQIRRQSKHFSLISGCWSLTNTNRSVLLAPLEKISSRYNIIEVNQPSSRCDNDFNLADEIEILSEFLSIVEYKELEC